MDPRLKTETNAAAHADTRLAGSDLPGTGSGVPATSLPPPRTPPDTAEARHFHHYEICLQDDGVTPLELGRGAMGASFKARDVNLDTPVAIKVISTRLVTQPQARERFRREARAAAQLRHPNVASVFHFGETPTGTCFYAMEFIEGETLTDKVKREGPLPAGLVIEIALQVTDALIAADARGLVHRDLKPSNLMLTARVGGGTTGLSAGGKAVVVKVIDFGLAKAVSAPDAPTNVEASLTQEGGFLGTPAYASPEQADGGEVDARSDIYSLGVTLWYLLAGQVPFAGRSFDEIYDRQRHRSLPLSQLTAEGVPAPLIELLKTMLAADPARRPASPGALYEALEHCRALLAGDLPAPATRARPHRAVPFGRTGRPRTAAWLTVAAAVFVLLAGSGAGAFLLLRHRGGTGAQAEASQEKSIAVLPLEDISEDKDNTFFADGIQDDLLNSLAKIKNLKVISRSSVMGYRQAATRDLHRIGQELGVATVLEGSVRHGPGRVIVDAALIDVRDGRRLWSERYDRALADALTLQGELATEIANALQTTLSPAEKARVEDRPTTNADAYVLYLRARDYQTRPYTLMQNFTTAESLYRQAIALDPDFALAHARLSSTLAFIYITFRPTPEIRAQAWAEAEASLRMRPDLGEGYLARALCLYWIDKNYPDALRELDIAARLMPGDAEIGRFVGAIHRRQGHYREALAELEHAALRDPRDAHIAWEVMRTHFALRDWAEAARVGDRVVALAPDNSLLKFERQCVDFWARGDLGPIREALAAVPPGFDPDGETTFLRWDTALVGRDFAMAERVVTASPLESIVAHFGIPLPKSYLLAYVAEAKGDHAGAVKWFEAALPAMETDARNVPLDAFRQARLGLLYAFLGRKEDALRQSQLARELLPESRDAFAGPNVSGLIAMIDARVGETDRAVARLGKLLRTPGSVLPNFEGSVTRSDLRARWQWDPLRGDKHFQAFVNGPEMKTEY